MHYEIHITVEAPNLDTFKNVCKKLEVKPIIIETKSTDQTQYQVMTSSKYNDVAEFAYLDRLIYLSYWLTIEGFNVLRHKVEIQPTETQHEKFLYYETHIRLKLLKDFDLRQVALLCKENGFHMSRNLFKTDDIFKYQMITFRSKILDYVDFLGVINAMKYELHDIQAEYDKVEIEECIFDSNQKIDESWLNSLPQILI